MRSYLATTGLLFATIAVVHVWRAIAEPHFATHAWYVLLTLAAAALSVWAWRLLRRAAGRHHPVASARAPAGDIMTGAAPDRSLRIVESATMAAPASVVYDLIADYHQGHPSILPPEYFEDLVVEAGGRGTGTRIRFTMKAYGSREVSCAHVTEPEPGRRLVETVEGRAIVTTFTVEPLPGETTRVTIATDYPVAGLRGWLERWVVPRYLRRVYAAELRLLEQRATA